MSAAVEDRRREAAQRLEHLRRRAPESIVAHAALVHRDDRGRRLNLRSAEHLQLVTSILEDAEQFPFVAFVVPPGYGKAEKVDTPVLTPAGWREHGALRVGDRVFAPDGSPVRVLVERDWGARPCYEVSFSDGTSVVADELHEWRVLCDRERYREFSIIGGRRYRPPRRVEEVLETRELLAGQRRAPAIPIPAPLVLPEQALTVDPWLLGLWLGNGDAAGGAITLNRLDAAHYATLGRRVPSAERPGSVRIRVPGLTASLRLLGVLGRKTIPASYLLASSAQRLRLLQGLMDSDGTVHRTSGQCSYSSVDEALARQVATLVRSLGMKASLVSGPAVLNGRQVGTHWRVTFHAMRSWPCVTVPRKVERLREAVSERARRVYVELVERVEDAETNCVQVEGGMYLVGEGLTPTHNSTFGSVVYPTWKIGRTGGRIRLGLVCNTARLAQGYSGAVMDAIRSAAFRATYPEVRPDYDRGWARAGFYVTGTPGGPNPTLVATGIAGDILGRRLDEIVLDDPTTFEDARSEVIMDKQRSWLRNTLLMRLPAGMRPPYGKGGRVIALLTRWSERDLVPTLADLGFAIVHLPALALEDDVMGREPGEALWPGVEPAPMLEKMRADDELIFELVYQGNPAVLAGDVFDAQFFQRGRPPMRPGDLLQRPALDFVAQYVDAAGGKDSRGAGRRGRKGDFCVVATVGIKGNEVWVLDIERGRFPAPELEAAVLREAAEWAPDLVVIEDTDDGRALYSRLVVSHRLPLKPYDPDQPKEWRAIPLRNAYRAWRVWHPEDAPWRRSFEAELEAFPNGRYDDQVDAASGAYNHSGQEERGIRIRSLGG